MSTSANDPHVMATIPMRRLQQMASPENRRGDEPAREQGWSYRRAQMHTSQKEWMAKYCVEHELLVIDGPAGSRDTVASILVIQGTTPNVVVREALDWMTRYWTQFGPFDVTWYTTSGLVMSTLRDFRVSNSEQSIAAQIFLFPGRVNNDMQAVSGPVAEQFVKHFDIDFTYAFLSAYAFDLESGRTRFQYGEEVALQTACARLYAAHKFLFIDSSKFRRDGTPGYSLSDLLTASQTVTIYTTSSTPERDKVIKERCVDLANILLKDLPDNNSTNGLLASARRTFRLRIVGPDNLLAESWQREGFFRKNGDMLS
jgi:hypothetical protein